MWLRLFTLPLGSRSSVEFAELRTPYVWEFVFRRWVNVPVRD